jgi:hypothetical protein
MERKRTMKTISFSASSPQIILIPRLDDAVINDHFYQDEEIAEFRHEWFMEKCGLSTDMNTAGVVLVHQVEMEQKKVIASPTKIATLKQKAKAVRRKWNKAAASVGSPTTTSSTTNTTASSKVTTAVPDTVKERVSVVTSSAKPRSTDKSVLVANQTKTMLKLVPMNKETTSPTPLKSTPPRNDGALPSHDGKLTRTTKTIQSSSGSGKPKRVRPVVDDNKNRVTTNGETTTPTVLPVVVATATSTPTTETAVTHNRRPDSSSSSSSSASTSSSESSNQNNICKDKIDLKVLLQLETTSPRPLLQQQEQRRPPSPPSLISTSSPRSVTEVYVRKCLPALADDKDTQPPTSHPLRSRMTKQRSARASMNDGEPHQDAELEPEKVAVDAKQQVEPQKDPLVLSPRASPLPLSRIANSYGNITKARLRIKGDWRPILPLG